MLPLHQSSQGTQRLSSKRKPKPILYISPLPPPNGGIATWTQKIMAYGLPNAQPIILINSRVQGNRRIFQPSKLTFAEIYRNLSIMLSLCYHLLRNRPRLVHINSSLSPVGIVRDYCCALLCKLLFVPVIVHYHSHMPDFPCNRLAGISGKLLKSLLYLADINIVINHPSYQFANQFVQHKKPVVFLPNFIEDHIFAAKKLHAPQALVSSDSSPQIRALFVGGITIRKGYKELLCIAQQFPNIEFHLYGELYDECRQLPQELPTNIVMHGEIPHQELLQYISHYHFLIFPSHSEGFPLTVLEAMAFGLPVIASRVGAITQMIDHGKGGFLCSPGDIAAFCNSVAALISQPQTVRTAMGDFNCDRCFQSYRYSKVIKDLMQIYQQIGSTCAG